FMDSDARCAIPSRSILPRMKSSQSHVSIEFSQRKGTKGQRVKGSKGQRIKKEGKRRLSFQSFDPLTLCTLASILVFPDANFPGHGAGRRAFPGKSPSGVHRGEAQGAGRRPVCARIARESPWFAPRLPRDVLRAGKTRSPASARHRVNFPER